MLRLLQKLYKENYLEIEETKLLIKNLDEKPKTKLYELASKTKEQYYGKSIYLRGLLEFSNICRQDCLYCGIRASNVKVNRYRLTPEEIFAVCGEGHKLGYRTFVLQSGEDPWYTTDIMINIIKQIKASYPEIALTLSIGERSYSEYQAMHDAGADRFLMRHETSSESLYNKLHPTMNFANRRSCLRSLKEIGFQVGAGFMVGLPGQTDDDLAEDLTYLKNLEPDMVGIGPFIPHKETPLGQEQGGSVEKTLVMVALTRLFLPEALIPATTALGSLHPTGRELALQVGANVVMPIITPGNVRRLYELYQNKICMDDEAGECRYCIENRILKIGLTPDFSRGDSLQSLRKA